MMAIGMIAGFRGRGIKIPEDLSIVGIDDMFLSAMVTPAITSVSPPIAAMAKVMVDRLIARLSDSTIAVEEFLFAPTLVSRESVADRSATSRTIGRRRSTSIPLPPTGEPP
jgi:DNA-binding LacI/PurR family transcriptional regulator